MSFKVNIEKGSKLLSKALYRTITVTTVTNIYKVFATAVRVARGAREKAKKETRKKAKEEGRKGEKKAKKAARGAARGGAKEKAKKEAKGGAKRTSY